MNLIQSSFIDQVACNLKCFNTGSVKIEYFFAFFVKLTLVRRVLIAINTDFARVQLYMMFVAIF